MEVNDLSKLEKEYNLKQELTKLRKNLLSNVCFESIGNGISALTEREREKDKERERDLSPISRFERIQKSRKALSPCKFKFNEHNVNI